MKKAINNDIYEEYGRKWYKTHDDPVALLRAEGKEKNRWILEKLEQYFGRRKIKILDIACGGGFLTNLLAEQNYEVSGIDISPSSIDVAREYDLTHSVDYQVAEANHLPYRNETFECVTCMDFLEHVEDPEAIIQEAMRVLKPGGLLFFHTFNRNLLSKLLVIHGVEILVKHCPQNLHVYELFIKPEELSKMIERQGGLVLETIGFLPKFFSKAFWKSVVKRSIEPKLEFARVKSRAVSYGGIARKR